MTAIPVIYRDEIADEVRAELLTVDGVLVWIDPIGRGEDRTRFDQILLDLSSAGVWVSAHPDTIALIGTKDVLYTHQVARLGKRRPSLRNTHRAAGSVARSPRRGSAGGEATARATQASESGRSRCPPTPLDRSREPHRSSCTERNTATPTSTRWSWPRSSTICAPYFANGGVVIDQAFQPRVTEGLVRVYLVIDTGGRILPTERGHTHHRRRERRPRHGLAVTEDDVPRRTRPSSRRSGLSSRPSGCPACEISSGCLENDSPSSGTPTSFSDHPQSTAPTPTCCARSTAAASRRSRPRRPSRSPAPRSTRSRRDGVRLRAVHSRRVVCSSTRALRRAGRLGS